MVSSLSTKLQNQERHLWQSFPPKKRREGTIAAVTSQGKTILTPGMATSTSTHLPPKNLLAAIRVMLFNPKTQTKIQLYELNCTNVGTEGTFFSGEDVAKTLVSLELERTTETLPEICCVQSDRVSWHSLHIFFQFQSLIRILDHTHVLDHSRKVQL